MPLLFDMPRDRLDAYPGTNPRPADFDAYWDRALAEMRAVDPAPEAVPAAFQAPFANCFDFTFTGVRGARLHARLVRPQEGGRPRPAVLVFHGYGCKTDSWFRLLPYAAMGYTAVALDCRGQAGQSTDPGGVPGTTLNGHIIRGLDGHPDQLMYRQIFLDTAQLAGLVMAMPEVDETRVAAIGGSQGGGLSLACAALEPRIRRVAPSFPFLCDYQRVWELDLAERAYAELREYFRRFDPLHEREEEVFTRLGYVDVQHLAPRIRDEVMMAVGLMDRVCPPSTQFAAYNKIAAPKSLVVYPDFGHEELPEHDDRVFAFLSQL